MDTANNLHRRVTLFTSLALAIATTAVAETTVRTPTTYASPSKLTINSAVTVLAKTGSIWDFTAGTFIGAGRLAPVQSVNGKTGTVSLNFADLSSHPGTISGYGITDFNALGDVRWPQLSSTYANPSWITSLAWSKITGAPTITSGTVTSVSVIAANGISGIVANPTTTPAITLALGAITPTTVNGNTITTSTGILTLGAGKTLAVTSSITLSSASGSPVTLNVGLGGTLGSAAFVEAVSLEPALGSPVTSGSVVASTNVGVRSWLTLGTAAVKNTGTTSGTIPLLGTGGRLSNGMIPLGLPLYDGSLDLSADFENRFLYDNNGAPVVEWSTGTFVVIGPADLANLSTNGFVKTSGGTGHLIVDTATYQPLNSNLTELTLVSLVDAGDWPVSLTVTAPTSVTLPTTGTVAAWVGVPATASSAGVAGQIARDAGFFYTCTATNTWKRVAISTW